MNNEMNNRQLSVLDLIIEAHRSLERQGPGSKDATIKALNFVKGLDEHSKILDLACGTGGQTMVIAKNTASNITGVDLIPIFVDIFNNNVQKMELQDRVHAVVGSMDDLSFEKDTFDLIWSEGAIDNIGFEKGIKYWSEFLKKEGYIAVTCPSWLTTERPLEIEKFWKGAVGGLSTVEENIATMQKSGYCLIASFVLPDYCWTDNYFDLRAKAEKKMLEKYAGNKIVEEYIKADEYEVELYSKYKQYYGYVFYIGKKIEPILKDG